MTGEKDYFHEYMKTAEGTPELLVRGVLLFFKSSLTNEDIQELEKKISNQDNYSINGTNKIFDAHGVPIETGRQITALLNKKFKEAISKREITTKKLDFIRNVKKKH